ncbi:MAG: VOC family protein [Gammaproteobacteria bacterium]
MKTRIETTQFDETVAFYTELVGLTVIETWDEGADRGAILGLGDSKSGQAFLELAPTALPKSNKSVSLQFRVSDIDAVAERLRDRWSFRGPEQRPWGSTYLYLTDPAGVRVILYEGEL